MNNKKGPITFFNEVYKEEDTSIISKSNKIVKSVIKTLDNYNMPKDIFLRNIETLKIQKEDIDENVYIGELNKIKCNDSIDIKRELFSSATYDETLGLSYRLKNGKLLGIALTNGIIDMFAKLNDKSFKTMYPFEKMVSETLLYIYGIEIFKYTFLNDAKSFLAAFKEPKLVIDLMDKLDKYESNYERLKISNNKKDKMMVNFYFGECLNVLTTLCYEEDEKRTNSFRLFIQNGLTENEMIDVMKRIKDEER